MMEAAQRARPGRTVYVIDDDPAVRDSLAMLFRTAGLRVDAFDSADAYLRLKKPDPAACLVLDIRMPGLSGTALHKALLQAGHANPVIFVTGHGDIPMAVDAVKQGAFDFVEKPFDDDQLLRQVLSALDYAADRRREQADRSLREVRLAQLSEREQQVLERVLAGKSSREIARELVISLKTVEFHRARIMGKLGVRSVAQLFRLCLGR